MPNVFKYSGCSLFRMRHDSLTKLQSEKSTPAATKVFTFLQHQAENNTRQLSLKTIREATGLSDKTIAEARRVLTDDLKLIEEDIKSGTACTFAVPTLQPDLETGKTRPYFQIPDQLMTVDSYRGLNGSTIALYLTCLAAVNNNPASKYVSPSILRQTAPELIRRAGLTPLTGRRALDKLTSGEFPFLKKLPNGRLEVLNPITSIPNETLGDDDAEDFDGFSKFSKEFTRADNTKYYSKELPDVDVDKVQQSVRCPFHDDHKASMSLNLEKGKGVWFCNVCEADGVVGIGGGMLDFEMKRYELDKADASRSIYKKLGRKYVKQSHGRPTDEPYLYDNADGSHYYMVQRFEDDVLMPYLWNPAKNKYNPLNRPGLKGNPRILGNLPKVSKASVVLIVEGERKARALQNYCDGKIFDGDGKPVVVTCSGGASSWKTKFADDLRGKRVIVLPDTDIPGERYGETVTDSLTRNGVENKTVYSDKYGHDVRDLLKLNPSPSDFVKFIDSPWLTVAPEPERIEA